VGFVNEMVMVCKIDGGDGEMWCVSRVLCVHC